MSFECSNRDPMSQSNNKGSAAANSQVVDESIPTPLNCGLTRRHRLWMRAQFLACAVALTACGGGGGGGSDPTASPSSDSPAPAPAPAATGTATMAWGAPQTNADGTALTDLAGYRIYYGTSSGSYSQSVTVSDATATEYTIENLPAATYYFVLRAFDKNNSESASSTEVSKTIQ